MKFRLALASLSIALATTGVAWLSMQPMLSSLLGALSEQRHEFAGWSSAVPLIIGLDVVIATAVVFFLLYWVVAVPLSRAEEAIDQIAKDTVEVADSGPVLSRLSQSLRRLSAALVDERERNRAQLDSLKASNEQLVRLQAELVAADRLATVGKLAAGVAHEVGNPLAGILGYLSVIRMRARGNDELAEVVDRIEREVQRIDQIVRALLELGRPSRGRAQPVDVRPVIDSCVQLLSAGREFREVSVRVECPSSLWLRAEAGPLSQVLVNLLINAAQAMRGQGQVTVRAEEEGAVGRIVVEDDGPGLAPEVLSRVFEPFFTTRPAGEGTGLGLAVSRHLLGQFEGTLEAGNRPRGGAAFTITLLRP
jgi:two-component system NtrC family sensor kinase